MHFNRFILISAFWCCVMATHLSVENKHKPSGDAVLIPVENESINSDSFLEPRVRRGTVEAEYLEKLLNGFIGQLKSYIHTTFFDSRLFEGQIDALSTAFEEISRQVQDLAPAVSTLLAQLRFAEHMFETMENSADLMENFNQMGRPDQAIINRIFELHVLVFKLYNTHGNLDYLVHEPALKVLQLWRQVRSLESSFALLDKVPTLSRRCFERQATQVREAVIRLWAQVSENEGMSDPENANCY